MHFSEPGCWGPWGQSADTLLHHFPHWTPISHRGGPLSHSSQDTTLGTRRKDIKKWQEELSLFLFRNWVQTLNLKQLCGTRLLSKTSDFCQREMSDIALSYLRATHFFLKSLRKELRKPPFWSCLGFWSLKEVCSLSLSSLGQNRVASSKCISWKHKRGMLFYSFPEYICPGCGTVLGLSTCLSYSPDYLWLVVPTKVCLGHEPSNGKRNTGELGSWGAREFGCSSVHLSINEYKSRQMVPSWTQPSR